MVSAPKQLLDRQGSLIRVGRLLGAGGEGAVYELAGDPKTVAKVYHRPLNAEKIAKLQAMAQIASPKILGVAAWPVSTVHDTARRTIGILLPRVDGFKEVHKLYSPAHRKMEYPSADWRFLLHTAMNCAAAFETIHAHGHVIGDVNQGNVLVSQKATICLIDCDSFQVSHNGSRFLCEVGVAQFTPPELQGQNFRSVVRNQNHDGFGLAVLLFHLLFMGRHPFAGRFLGKGEMPIEQAIADCRFAFSRMAQTYNMSRPPHSLPLDTVSAPVASLFERAFGPESRNGSPRPSAQEWRMALARLRDGVRRCPQDEGHCYPAHLKKCPWCEVADAGGPNFFISVAVYKGTLHIRFNDADIKRIWAKITSIQLPPVTLGTAQHQPIDLAPTPLPAEVDSHKFLTWLARSGTVAGAIVAALGAALQVAALVFGVLLLVIFGVFWIAVEIRSPRKKELRRREHVRTECKGQYNQIKSQWEAKAHALRRELEVRHRALSEKKDRFDRLEQEYRGEHLKLEATKRENQLHLFLQSKCIDDYQIPLVGPVRQATLASYGVETADEVTKAKLRAVPGVGPRIAEELISWRTTLEKQFRFDPNRGITQGEQNALVMKYSQMQQRLKAELTFGAQELHALAEKGKSELFRLAEEAHSRYAVYLRAEADLRVI